MIWLYFLVVKVKGIDCFHCDFSLCGLTVRDTKPKMSGVKVHGGLCSELEKLISSILRLSPEIEAARPRASGMEALTLLTNGVSKANSLIHHCTHSSILYLVLTANTVLARCKKFRNLVDHSLTQIQHTVPIILSAKISQLLLILNSINLCLDPSEAEAARILRDLINTYDKTIGGAEEFALAALHSVCSTLGMSSQKALLIEKRSIRNLVDKLDQNNREKRKLLIFFLNLINKYIKSRPNFQHHQTSAAVVVQGRGDEEMLPPKEFLCPLSARIMLDPVVIASGETFERMWIEKWFEEGQSTCPKTGVKLDHLGFTANVVIRDIIAKWCADHHHPMVTRSWETSSNSISSLTSCISNLSLVSSTHATN